MKAFTVPAEQADHVLDKAFKRVLIRLVARPIHGHSLVVEDPERAETAATPAQP